MKKKTNDLPRVGSEIQDIVPLRRARILPIRKLLKLSRDLANKAFVGRCLCQRADALFGNVRRLDVSALSPPSLL